MSPHAPTLAGPSSGPPTSPLPLAALDLLAAMSSRGLAAHSSRVFRLAGRVCRRMELDRAEASGVALAALLHDVGKLAVPRELLEHPGELDDEQRTVLRDHAEVGERVLRRRGLDDLAVLVRHSHERWDGHGYPDALAGPRIPLGARIIAACDAWDAMRSDRPYRDARPHDEALLDLLDSSGTQLDPAVVTALLAEVGRPGLT